jgi:hypothetical protein
MKARAAKAAKAKLTKDDNSTKTRSSSMFYLYIFSWILTLANKLPFINKIVSVLSLWYGRTTIWKILVKIRKMFIIFNAIIGLVMVYKTTGYNHETFLALFTSMGHSYLEIFINMNKRIFNWFYNLFDNSIPNVYNGPTPPKVPSYMWHPRGVEGYWHQKLPDLSKIPNDWSLNPFDFKVNNESTPWYRDTSSWLFYGSVFLVSACLLGAGLICYKSIFGSVTPDININPGTPSSGTATPAIGTSTSELVDNIASTSNSIISPFKYLNPGYCFNTPSNTSLYDNLLATQTNATTFDNRYYPFTEVNPFKPWYEKIRIKVFGETVAEEARRLAFKNSLTTDYFGIIRSYSNDLSSPIVSPMASPMLNTLGLRNVSGHKIQDIINAGPSYDQIWNKLTSTPNTPNINPSTLLPELEGG